MNLDIYEDAERLAKRYETRDPFELLDAMNVVVKFTDKFPKDGLKRFCTFINKTSMSSSTIDCPQSKRVSLPDTKLDISSAMPLN